MTLVLYAFTALILVALSVALWRAVLPDPTVGGIGALIVSLGLVYDNTVIALGRFLGEGGLLLALNWPRYVIHAFATPLLIVFAWDAARRARLGWARGDFWRIFFWLLTLVMIAYGVIFELLGTRLEFTIERGVASYSSSEPGGVPVPAVATVLALLAVGISLWRSRSFAALAIASVLSIVGFSVAPSADLPVVGQLAEVALIGGILLTETWLRREGRSEQRRTEELPRRS